MEIDEVKLSDKVIAGLKGKTLKQTYKDGELILSWKLENITAERFLRIDNELNHITVYTESTTIKGSPETWLNCIQFISRINEFLQLGCLEIEPESYKIRYRIGQSFHPITDPMKILNFFISQHDIVFPKIMESFVEVINNLKSPHEAAHVFIRPLDFKRIV
ncbi:hypothetical protein SteCoe_4812 [Stentor coeruleus]|uniref:Uncharacterized protein n=1 Tax=Stentor coeruleus TaxID=5963 RepID=A0A1R2CU27_9CILI|nr:hypothetical protein SteCoe_4812 [Stentor coeruleus]